VLPGWNKTLLPSCIILLVYPQEDCGVPVPAAGVAWLEHNPASQLYNIAGKIVVSQYRLQVLPGWNLTLLPNCVILLVYSQEACGVPVPAAGVAWLEHNYSHGVSSMEVE
jgi:hypothetical protein